MQQRYAQTFRRLFAIPMDNTTHIPTAHGHTQVSRNLLKRATSEVRRALKDVQSISFEIRGEDLKEKVRGSGVIDRLTA